VGACVVQAIEKGNMEGARIYAENAIREKNQSLYLRRHSLHTVVCPVAYPPLCTRRSNYLRLASRIDAVAGRVETAVRMRQVPALPRCETHITAASLAHSLGLLCVLSQVTRSMSGIVKNLEAASKSMNLEKVLAHSAHSAVSC
jgi:charged multivesicular body protein 1